MFAKWQISVLQNQKTAYCSTSQTRRCADIWYNLPQWSRECESKPGRGGWEYNGNASTSTKDMDGNARWILCRASQKSRKNTFAVFTWYKTIQRASGKNKISNNKQYLIKNPNLWCLISFDIFFFRKHSGIS